MSKVEKKAVEPMEAEMPEVRNVYQAFANFSMDAPILTKNEEGYGYKYVHLAEIVDKVKPILYKHDLVIVQTLKGTGLLTQLVHVPSETMIESFCEIPQNVEMKGQNLYQVYGSAITYFRRYQWVTICNLVAEDDLDTRVQKTGKPKLESSRLKEAKKALIAGEITMQEIMDRFTLTQAQKQELIS